VEALINLTLLAVFTLAAIPAGNAQRALTHLPAFDVGTHFFHLATEFVAHHQLFRDIPGLRG
jgi:hypothetical protein